MPASISIAAAQRREFQIEEGNKMAVRVITPSPQALLAALKKAIDEKKVETWKYDSQGDFTHTPQQWTLKCWLRPHVEAGALVFTTIPPKNTALSREIYGIYHGRFIEMLLAHFDQQFSQVGATALAAVGDLVGASA